MAADPNDYVIGFNLAVERFSRIGERKMIILEIALTISFMILVAFMVIIIFFIIAFGLLIVFNREERK